MVMRDAVEFGLRGEVNGDCKSYPILYDMAISVLTRLGASMLKRIIGTMMAVATFSSFWAEVRADTFTIEGGVTATQNMALHGYNQSNATSGWRKNGPEVRFEYWTSSKNGWNYGIALQPLSLSYSGFLKDKLTYNGVQYNLGAPAKLDYQFPTFRVSANYPVYETQDGGSWIRAGGSVIASGLMLT